MAQQPGAGLCRWLNDYDDDYLSGSYGNAPIKTSYQVGKGLLEHVLEMARQDEMAEDDLRSLDKEENLAKDDDACVLAGEESDETDESEREMAGEQEPARQEPDFSRPRRMVFHFDGNNA